MKICQILFLIGNLQNEIPGLVSFCDNESFTNKIVGIETEVGDKLREQFLLSSRLHAIVCRQLAMPNSGKLDGYVFSARLIRPENCPDCRTHLRICQRIG